MYYYKANMETRNAFDNDKFWTKKLPNGVLERYNKDYYNADFTKKKETRCSADYISNTNHSSNLFEEYKKTFNKV